VVIIFFETKNGNRLSFISCDFSACLVHFFHNSNEAIFASLMNTLCGGIKPPCCVLTHALKSCHNSKGDIVVIYYNAGDGSINTMLIPPELVNISATLSNTTCPAVTSPISVPEDAIK